MSVLTDRMFAANAGANMIATPDPVQQASHAAAPTAFQPDKSWALDAVITIAFFMALVYVIELAERAL